MVYMTHIVPRAAGVTTPAAKGFQPEILCFQPRPFIIRGTQPVPFSSCPDLRVCVWFGQPALLWGAKTIGGRAQSNNRGDLVAVE